MDEVGASASNGALLSAGTDRWSTTRGALAAATLSVALLATLAVRAQAEPTVTVTPTQVSTALFVAGDVARLSKIPSGTEDVVLEKALQQMYADEPELSPTTAESYVRDMQLVLSAPSAPSPASLQLMAGNQRILAILAALERPYGSPAIGLPAAAKLAVSHLAAVALSGSSDIFAASEEPKYFEPLADARTNLSYTSFAPASVLRATRQLAAANHEFGEARDALWAKASEESVFSEWEALIGESKVLQSEALKEVREAVESGKGTIVETPEALTALFSAGQKKTQEESCEHPGTGIAISGEAIEGVHPLECSGGALYEAKTAPRTCTSECLKELERREQAAGERGRAIAQERAEMIAAAELLRPSDNKAAALQEATAQAQAQITEEEVAWAAYEAQKAEKEEIAGGVKEGLGVGTAVLALGTDNLAEGIGGLVNSGFEIYENVEGALSNPPPGPQEITLEDLADLSEQLAGFQEYTQEAFHAINTQLAQLSSQLARENYELKAGLKELGERLVKEQGTIYALQDEVQTLFATQTKANLQQTIEDSVGWLARTGEPLAPYRFQEALVALKKDATEIANGALVNNSETQPYSFEGADRQLTSKTTGEPTQLSEDISYLARFPGELGWPSPPAPSSLANTTFWAESARAYAQLMLENAGHTTSADVAGLKTLENEALKLEKTEGAWSEASDPGSRTGNAILNEALARFEKAAYGEPAGVDGTSSVQGLLAKAAERSFEESLKSYVNPNSPTANPTGVELWGGAEQPFSAKAVAEAKYPALEWKECGGVGKNGTQEMPEAFIASLPRALVDGVRLGVIGAPTSGDWLSLEACRTITKTLSTETLEASNNPYEINCPNEEGFLINKKDCQLVYRADAVREKEAETVTETLTLKERSGSTVESSSVGECKQTSLFWTGKGEDESRDPEDEELNGDDYSKTSFGGKFEERHVGSIYSLSLEGEKTYWTYSSTAIEGTPCPYPAGDKEEAGIEYAKYGENDTSPLSGAEPTIVKQVDERLGELQREAYGADLGALKSPTLVNVEGDPAESLAGARALVQSLVKLGLPQALGSDVALQEEIDGAGAQFLDPQPGSPRPLPEELQALIGSWIGRLETATTPAEVQQLVEANPIEEVRTRSEAWADTVAERLEPYIEEQVNGFDTGEGEAVGEQSALVESTLDRMQLTRDVLTEARAPTAETLAPSEVGTDEATVRGEVDANEGAVESCLFEYGATSSYGHSVECSTTPSPAEKAVVVSAKIVGWTPEGSFHERVVLKTWGGTSYGEDVKVQLAQSTSSPTGGTLIASTDTSGATIGGFTAEELPPGVELPAGAEQIVGSVAFTVNVKPGGSVRVKIELPSGSAPNALFKLEHVASGHEEYVEMPSSQYTINGNTVELTLVDGGAGDEDGEANGVIVDPLVPVAMTRQAESTPGEGTHAPSTTTGPPTATIASPAGGGQYSVGDVVKTSFSCAEATGGPGLASCVDSAGASGGVGTLDTEEVGVYTYKVTATSRDGQTSTASVSYAVVARHECVSDRRVTLHVTYHVQVPAGASLQSSTVLLGGHVLARLHGPTETAGLHFKGKRRKPPFAVTLVSKLSNGEVLRRRVVFHGCVGVPRTATHKAGRHHRGGHRKS